MKDNVIKTVFFKIFLFNLILYFFYIIKFKFEIYYLIKYIIMFASLEIAKKRQQQLLNSFTTGFKRWAINKEYSVVFHDNKSEEILLNSSLFKDMNSTELIEITLVSNQNFKLIFSIDKKKI